MLEEGKCLTSSWGPRAPTWPIIRAFSRNVSSRWLRVLTYHFGNHLMVSITYFGWFFYILGRALNSAPQNGYPTNFRILLNRPPLKSNSKTILSCTIFLIWGSLWPGEPPILFRLYIYHNQKIHFYLINYQTNPLLSLVPDLLKPRWWRESCSHEAGGARWQTWLRHWPIWPICQQTDQRTLSVKIKFCVRISLMFSVKDH